MKAMLQKNPHLFWSFIVPWDSRICQLRQRTTSKSHGLLEASVIAHNFCCPHPRISQGRGSVRGEPLTGSPTRVQSPARRRPVLRCKTVPTRKKTRFCVSFFVLVRPTGFEPAAFRVGVIRPSSWKTLRRKGLVEIAQISAILKKNLGSLTGQDFRGFCSSSQIVVCAPRRSYDSVQLSDPTQVSY